MEINELFGKYALGTIRPEDYIAWAEQLLTTGIESPSLPVLAGMDLNRPVDSIEVYECFRKVTTELGIDWPDESAALQRYSEILCQKILEEKIEPGHGLSSLAKLYAANDYSGGLYATWDCLEEDISLLYTEHGAIFNTGLTEENRDDYIRKVARQYLQLIQLQLPENFFERVFCQNCKSIQPTRTVRIDKPWMPERLYRLIYHKGPTWELRCIDCGSRNLQSMNDFAGRANYLEIINKDTQD